MGPHDALLVYLRAQDGIPFAWGEHDCLTFTNGAWRAMYGHGWADDWLGRYLLNGKPRCREAMILEFGFKSFEEAVDLRLQPAGKYPPRGALVSTTHARRWVTGVALGICVGTHCAFLTDKGLTYLPIEMITNSWIEK